MADAMAGSWRRPPKMGLPPPLRSRQVHAAGMPPWATRPNPIRSLPSDLVAQGEPEPVQRPSTRRMGPELGVPHRAEVDSCATGQFLLRETQPESGRPDPAGQAGALRNEARSKRRLERPPASRPRQTQIPLPASDALLPVTKLLGEGSLRQAVIHPPLADPLAECSGVVRVTPWKLTRSGPAEVEVAEWQRNGVDPWTRASLLEQSRR
jgi:hypothetical protein